MKKVNVHGFYEGRPISFIAYVPVRVINVLFWCQDMYSEDDIQITRVSEINND